MTLLETKTKQHTGVKGTGREVLQECRGRRAPWPGVRKGFPGLPTHGFLDPWLSSLSAPSPAASLGLRSAPWNFSPDSLLSFLVTDLVSVS